MYRETQREICLTWKKSKNALFFKPLNIPPADCTIILQGKKCRNEKHVKGQLRPLRSTGCVSERLLFPRLITCRCV
jgi:hypothetical protein